MALISVYDDAGNVIETHEHTGDFKAWWSEAKRKAASTVNVKAPLLRQWRGL